MASKPPDRNLALELVRVTEAAAMGAGRWIGRGDKIAADKAAVDAMRIMLDTVAMAGVVVRLAERHGLEVPTVRTIDALLRFVVKA